MSLGSVAQNTNNAQTQSAGSNQAQTPSATRLRLRAALQLRPRTALRPPAPARPRTRTAAQKPTKTSQNQKKKSKNAQNPIADVDSKQPDKVLFDRAMDAMKHNKYDVARLSLQTLINTYPDSEYIARAKLAIGDSWYQEGGSAAMAQAESEYKDFITFFPNMPEAAEAQMKIANIHYKEMEKADRDPTHAKRAEDEYRQLILQFPDSPLVPQAKQRLLEVQEVLADREYMIGHFYFLRESYPAAIARLQSVADTYPLYSGADQALFELGNAYEREVELIRRSKLPEVSKGVLIKQYTQGATAAYDRILTRYPLEERAGDARKRLEAMKQPIPQATPEAIAQDKAEIASRGSMGHIDKVMENFRKGPNVTEAAKVGEPTLVDPKQASAPEIVRAANSSIVGSLSNLNGNNKVSVERVDSGAASRECSSPTFRCRARRGSWRSDGRSVAGNTGNTAVPELQNDLHAGGQSDASGAPEKAPPQVNDAAPVSSARRQFADGSRGQQQQRRQAQAAAANPTTESTSKKKKKKLLGIF